MANLEVIALDTAAPQLRAPGVGDGYVFPRQAVFNGDVGIGTSTPLGNLDVRQTVDNTTMIYGQRQTNSGGGLGNFIDFKDATPSVSQFKVDVQGNVTAGRMLLDSSHGAILPYTLDAGDTTTIQNVQGYRFRQRVTTVSSIAVFSIEPKFEGGGNYTSFLINSNDVSVGSSAKLIDLQSNGTSRFSVLNSGNVGIGVTPSAVLHLKAGTAAANTAPLKFSLGTNLTTAEAGAMEYNGADLFFTRSGTTRETVITSAAGVTQLSTFDAVSPIAQTLQSQGSRTGTDNNVAGASLTVRPGKGTGSATPGALILQSYVAVASGSSAQTAATTLTLNNGVPVFPSFTVAGLPPAATAGAGARVFVTDSLVSTTVGIGTTVANGGANFVPVYSDGANWKIG